MSSLLLTKFITFEAQHISSCTCRYMTFLLIFFKNDWMT